MKRLRNGADAIREQAADWLIRRQAGLTAPEEARFRAWCAGDSRCAAAFAEAEATWAAVTAPQRNGQAALALEWLQLRGSRRRRRRVALTAVALAASVVVGIATFTWPSWTDGPGDTSVVIRPDRHILPDGSSVELNAASDIEVAYSPERRLVRLVRGEALFTVAKDPQRPFVVSAGGVDVRAVGTAFTVRMSPGEVDVVVTHGEVLVQHRSAAVTKLEDGAPIPTAILPAGHRAQVSRAPSTRAPIEVARIDDARLQSALAWRGKRVEFTHSPLPDVLERFNWENEIKFTVEPGRAAEIRISGIFWVDDPHGFLRLIEKGFNLQSERTGNTIHLQPR